MLDDPAFSERMDGDPAVIDSRWIFRPAIARRGGDLMSPHTVVECRIRVPESLGVLAELIVMGCLQMMVRRSLILCGSLKVIGILLTVVGRGLPMLICHGRVLV